MDCKVEYGDLGAGDWDALREDIDPKKASDMLAGLLSTFRTAGAVHFVEESAYTDRDFSSAYTAYFSTLYRHRSKYCRRLHFFAADLSEVWRAGGVEERALLLTAAASASYLGYIVIRPISHAPVSRALISSRHVTAPGDDVSVRSNYIIHLLGAELHLEGTPVTEQDSLTGSCAQAAIWVAGRHIHNRHSMPWFSISDITEAAIKPADSILAKSLPTGAEALNDDSIVRALKAMGEHPVVYSPEREGAAWDDPPRLVAARYLDSGIPVIIGLPGEEETDARVDGDRPGRTRQPGMGHAVVAVGTVTDPKRRFADREPTPADRISALIVNDDQHGIYQKLPIDNAASGDDALDKALFLIVPLPAKVSMKAEFAATAARDRMAKILREPAKYFDEVTKNAGAPGFAPEDTAFYATPAERLVARTYLTQGWKYKHRLIRNNASEKLKGLVAHVHLPRYVWVTEFGLEEDSLDLDPCKRCVRGHVVVDATSNRYDDDSVLIVHVPGLVQLERFDPNMPNRLSTDLTIISDDRPYFPKVKGWPDYGKCKS